jgi:protein-ribulosamine 3-kinase
VTRHDRDSRRWQDAVVATLMATPDAVGADFDADSLSWSRISGDMPTSAWSLELGNARFFVRLTDPANRWVLAAEADGLRAIARTGAIRVPRVVASGADASVAFLVLEWLDIVDGGRDAALGHALARMHGATSSRFGWQRDNTIGATPQANAWSDDWTAFFRDRRLRPQLELAERNGYGGALRRDGEKLLERIPHLLDGHRPTPSLLHGDLWAGNAGRLRDGSPVIYDPATYYGDRETDLAMTELFGGFGPAFHATYREAMPLPAGYERRRTLYNLYHVLNHLNLFGEAYLVRAERMAAELLAAR